MLMLKQNLQATNDFKLKTMKEHTSKYYYNWLDIQEAICVEMNIDNKKYFRNYHKLIGGSYKNLWHEWLNHFDTEVRNDRTNYVGMDEEIDNVLDSIKEDGKEWLEPFVRAVYKVWDKYKIEHVRYCW